MTATHYCEVCKKKTTHQAGSISVQDSGGAIIEIPAIRCVYCNEIVCVTIKEEEKDG